MGIGAASFALFGLAGWAAALFGWLLLTLALLDFRHFILPDWLNALLLSVGLIASLTMSGPVISDRLLGVALGYGAIAIIGWCYRRLRNREGLGGGDPKLLGAIGAWTGWQLLPLIVMGAAVLGLAIAATMRLSGKTVTATTRLPLGTLLAVAAWPTWLLFQLDPQLWGH